MRVASTENIHSSARHSQTNIINRFADLCTQEVIRLFEGESGEEVDDASVEGAFEVGI